MISTYTATRYIVPLKEGGSLPAVLDTDTGGTFVAKFRGAGQGAKALIAEIIVGGIAEALDLPMPEVALIDVDETFGRSEGDPEIQDILRGSRGVNVGLRYLAGAFNYDPLAIPDIDPEQAAGIVWLDALTTNIDRTPRNPNLMVWEERLWLIDHGAALYFHHNWPSVDETKMRSPFAPIADHVLLPFAGDIAAADERLHALLTAERLGEIVNAVPDELLMDAPAGTEPAFTSAEENRDAYRRYFTTRLEAPRAFAAEAEGARVRRKAEEPTTRSYRR
jgi:hypothetical protein